MYANVHLLPDSHHLCEECLQAFTFSPSSVTLRAPPSPYTELTLYFWIFTHKQDALYKGRLRNDILNRELKLLFNDNKNIGIAKNHLLYSKVYSSGNYDYMGRHMAFKITDWADEVRYGKK